VGNSEASRGAGRPGEGARAASGRRAARRVRLKRVGVLRFDRVFLKNFE
jgi:hypothetical protein